MTVFCTWYLWVLPQVVINVKFSRESFHPLRQVSETYVTTPKPSNGKGHQLLFRFLNLETHHDRSLFLKLFQLQCFFIPPLFFKKQVPSKTAKPSEGHSRGLPLCHWPGATLCSAARTEGEDRTFHVKFDQGRVFGKFFEALGSSKFSFFSSFGESFGAILMILLADSCQQFVNLCFSRFLFGICILKCELKVTGFVLIEHETQLRNATVMVAPSAKKFAQLLPSLKPT